MKNKEFVRVLKFTLFSVSAGIIQIMADTIGLEVLHWKPHVSYLIALILSVLYNFTVNRRFTFKSANNIPVAMLKVARFYVIFTPLSTWWTKVLTDGGANEYVVLVGTMLVNFVTEFLYCKFVVYRHSEDTNDLAKRA